MIKIQTPEKAANHIPGHVSDLARAANGLPNPYAHDRGLIADVRFVPFNERDGGHAIPKAIGDIASLSVKVSEVPTGPESVLVSRR